jgi:hypothetical protein
MYYNNSFLVGACLVGALQLTQDHSGEKRASEMRNKVNILCQISMS